MPGCSHQVRGPQKAQLEGELETELCGEGNADGGAGAEEITESAGGYAELFVAGDWRSLRAGGGEAEGGGVGEIVYGSGESGDVADGIVGGILAIEKIGEIGEGAEVKSF